MLPFNILFRRHSCLSTRFYNSIKEAGEFIILQNAQTRTETFVLVSSLRFCLSIRIKTRSMRIIPLRLRVIQGTNGIQRVELSLFEGVERRLHGDERRSRSWVQSESYDVGGCSWQPLVHQSLRLLVSKCSVAQLASESDYRVQNAIR